MPCNRKQGQMAAGHKHMSPSKLKRRERRVKERQERENQLKVAEVGTKKVEAEPEKLNKKLIRILKRDDLTNQRLIGQKREEEKSDEKCLQKQIKVKMSLDIKRKKKMSNDLSNS